MTDQISTPGSNADSSANISKASLPKDKSCPFCHQPFTSSSLGRHLDLYIKEKNPKPPDELHNVEEIRKLRGGITRRQPRNSMPRNEGSTPGGTPGVNGEINGKRSPQSEVDKGNDHADERKSPTIRRARADLNADEGKGCFHTWARASWQATGVINDIPSIASNGSAENCDQEGNGVAPDKRPKDSRRSVSRQTLAKVTFDQKQKMMEALDNARAAELALREVLGSVRAANRRVKPCATPLDYDPLSLEFSALVLHCLPPPPTLNQVAPIPSPGCWSINPPERLQYEALRAHFRDIFQAWRINRVVTSPDNPDETMVYTAEVTSSAEDEADINDAARELEENVLSHLHSAFTHWSSMDPTTRANNWRLQLAKAVGHKEHSISSLKADREKILQENAHLRTQVEQLSMCQQPREFQMMPPSTVELSSKAAIELGKFAARGGGVGLNINDKTETIDGLVKTAVGRWLNVVQSSRTNSGMASQRSLDEPRAKGLRSQQSISQIQNQMRPSTARKAEDDRDEEMDLDGDTEAYVDAEEGFVVTNSTATHTSQANGHVAEVPMGMKSTGYGSHDRMKENMSRDVESRNGQYRGNRVVL